ncbi:uncharacterized protein J4E84_008677 [Alternaria hordeiaustralica]|uniref:uncharacterized protein n=1 Tax=Alternaria hordeiaustralica TaxID=1187925 RepID=UPI0020C53E88|nr:uncharacterized protein J4E84_008677 [Alternaria hordeiaustralica]KAI4678422.1 hypothetical protein J4E84_008677 [Alternaria hordeiaustralica]
MDATSPEMIDFVIVPIETMVACNFILFCVAQSIQHMQVPGVTDDTEIFHNVGSALINDIASWPLIVKEHSRCHTTIKQVYEAASNWLSRSPLFDDTRNELALYLELPTGFSVSDLKMRDNGAILNRGTILLKQPTRDYYKSINSQYCFLSSPETNKRNYRAFLTQLMWARDDPLARMFKSDFKGEFQDHQKVTNIGELSHQLESLSVADGASTVAMDTPSTTRAPSPALTERQDNPTADRATESKPIEPPTLKYIAVIETANDKAVFNLDTNKVDEKQHKILVNAKEMCDEMVSMSYGGKTKLQDVMDLTVQMATKWEEVRGKQAIQEKKVYGGFGYY